MSEFPQGWIQSKIGDLINLNPKNHCDDKIEVGFLPMQFLGTNFRDLPKSERRKWQEVKKGYTHFADNDVLLAKITPCFENGKAGIPRALPNGLGAGSTEYFVCRVLKNILTPEYLLAFFKTEKFLQDGEVTMTGSVGHKRVAKDFLLNAQIPLPPFNEQKRIADKLDQLLAAVDSCKTRLDTIPGIIKRFRQSLLAAATSGELTADWREEMSITNDWPTIIVGEAAFVTKLAGFEYTKFVKYRQGGDLRVIKAENAGKWGFKFTDFSTVFSEEVSMLTRSKIHEGDILMVFVGAGTGQVARVPSGDNWFLGPNIAMIRTDSKILNAAYLEHYCRSPKGVDEIAEFIKSVAQPSLSMKTIRQIPVPLPTIEEQQEIVCRVEALFAVADHLEARYQSVRAQVDQLTPSLLAKAFRGELVQQDPNDEPAEKLLEWIKAGQIACGDAGTKARQRKTPVKK